MKALHARLERLEQEKSIAAASVQGQGLTSGQGLEQEKLSESTPVVEAKVEVEVAAV